MWILENWQRLGESQTEVQRKFRVAFDVKYHRLPHSSAFRQAYHRMKKNKGTGHLVGGSKVNPDRFSFTPECQNPEQVEAVREHFMDNPSDMSVKERSLDLDMPESTVNKILRYNIGMKAFKILGTIHI